jgi:hypothetical protein
MALINNNLLSQKAKGKSQNFNSKVKRTDFFTFEF